MHGIKSNYQTVSFSRVDMQQQHQVTWRQRPVCNCYTSMVQISDIALCVQVRLAYPNIGHTFISELAVKAFWLMDRTLVPQQQQHAYSIYL